MKYFFLIIMISPSFVWASSKCDQLSIIAEDTMRLRQADTDFYEVIKPVIDGYITKVKGVSSLLEVNALTGSLEQVLAIAELAHKSEIETDGKLQNEAIYSFSNKVKTVCLEHYP